MAQTKASTSRRRAASNSRTRSSKTSRSRSNASRARSANRAQSSPNGAGGAESIKETVKAGTQNSAQRVAAFAKKAKTPLLKAKTPLLTGGAALAGVAGATVLNARSRRRHKVLGIPLPKRNGLKVDAQKMTEAIADAAKRADRISQRVSRVANGVQTTAETANATAKKS